MWNGMEKWIWRAIVSTEDRDGQKSQQWCGGEEAGECGKC